MTRMMDILRTQGMSVPEPATQDRSLSWYNVLATAPVIVADNVVRYYFSCEQERWDMRQEFPVIAPPMDLFWVEGRTPPTFWSQGTGRIPWPDGWPIVHGWSVASVKVEGNAEGRAKVEAFWRNQTWSTGDPNVWLNKPTGPGVEEPGWVMCVEAYVLIKGNRRVVGPKLRWLIELTKDGGINYDQDGRSKMVLANVAALDDDVMTTICDPWLHPLLLTLTFLHCRNVETRDVAPSPRLSRAYQRRGGKEPLVSYRVLDIEPFRKEAQQRGGGATGRRQALHTRRGHFKTFSSERPLFGRHVGTYWWDHVREAGDIAAGQVVKDYRVGGRAT